MEGGQSGTYLRLTRASSGPRVSVTKTYRQETFVHILLLMKATVIWPKYSFSFRFISICLSDAHPWAGRCSCQS